MDPAPARSASDAPASLAMTSGTVGDAGEPSVDASRPAEPRAAPPDDAVSDDGPADAATHPGSASPGGGDTLLNEADWLDRLCPYLLSEDGTYRSTEPDPDHRCTAQDPPGTLPIAFQERYCLTERHVRCEMFKFAQSAREAALGSQDGSAAAQVSSARFRPSVRSVPVAVGPSRTSASEGTRSRRPSSVIVAVIGGGVLLLLVFLALALSGGGSDPGGAGESAAPTRQPTTTPPPTQAPVVVVTQPPEASRPPASDAAGSDAILIEYEVQGGEALVKIAETFGTTRSRILDANEGMRDKDPYTEAGDVIVVPVSASMDREEIEAQPGFVDYAE